MSHSISPLGWVLIIFLALLIIGLFVSLFTHLKHKNKEPGWISMMQNAGKTMRDPFGEENKKLNELSDKIQQLNPKIDLEQHNGNLPTGVKE